jgi:hypothetical protein
MVLPDILVPVGGLAGLSAIAWVVKRFLQKHLSVVANIRLHFAWGRNNVRIDERKTKRYHRPPCRPRRAR